MSGVSNNDCGLIRQSFLNRAELVEQTGNKITKNEWNSLRMNSYEREFLMQFVDDETLVVIAAQTLDNCSEIKKSGVCTTYDEFAVSRLLPEFMRRMRENL